MLIDPSRCTKNILDLHGEAGAAWLEKLPELAAECARRWSLTLLPPFEYESFSYVCPALREDGENVFLKLAVPHPEVTAQFEMLQLCEGKGMVRLLDGDSERGILLMERALPGTMLNDMQDDAAKTEIAAQLMRRQWRPVPPVHHFNLISDWVGGLDTLHGLFEDGYGPFPRWLIDRARRLFKDLLAEDDTTYLIHGDANPFNILRSEREAWLFVDPKGAVGHPLYDAGVFLNNLPEGASPHEKWRILDRRVSQFADILGFERRLVKGWGQAQVVLAGFWTYEDHGEGWEPVFADAELYENISDS